MLDIDKLTDALVSQTMKAVEAATAPLMARIDALEKALTDRPAPADGRLGKDADPEVVAALVHDRIKAQLDAMHEAVEGIPPAPELPDIPAMIKEAVAEAVKVIPVPEDGVPGQDGLSVAAEDVLPALQEQVAKFLETIPLPKDGQPGRDGRDGKDGTPGEKGANGIGLAGAMIDRDGGLIVTLTNGEAKSLGVVVGKDGDRGIDGADGRNGRDGTDGLGFDDLNFEYDAAGRLVAKFQRGDVVRSAVLPGIYDRGVWKEAGTYQTGDGVSYGGSFWIAGDDATGRPDTGNGWRLAVKRGRDGKAGAPGEKGERGLPGERGRDLTQLGADGGKW